MIRRAEARDAAALAELITQLGYPATATEVNKRLRLILGEPKFTTFVAVEGDKVCGMIGLSGSLSYEHNDWTGRIAALAWTSRYERRGVGRQLIAAAEYFTKQSVSCAPACAL